MGPRTKEASLVLCIVLLACTISLASEHVVPPIFGIKVESIVAHGSGGPSATGSASKTGTLLIEATTSGSVVSSDVFFPTPYMSGVGLTVVPTGPAPLFPKTYETNSTGGFELSLPPANYSISFFASAELPFNSSVPVHVYQGETTFLQVAVEAVTYEPVYVGMPANQTDVVSAWSSGTLELSSPDPPVALGLVSAVFLDLYYTASFPVSDSNQTAVFSLLTPVQVPVLVTGWSIGGASLGSEQWVSFQPETPISLEGLSSTSISVYYMTTNVTIAQTVSYGGTSSAD